MIVGIIGLPQSGKTTLFNAICGTHQETGGYTAAGEVHRGIVKVPDERLDVLAEIYKPNKINNAEIEWMDIAGFIGDSSDRNRIDSEIPSVIREANAIAHVVRVFEDSNLPHTHGSISPSRDIQMVEDELIFSDLVAVEKRLERIRRQLKVSTDENMKREAVVLERCLEQLTNEGPLREMLFSKEEETLIKGFQFLSIKPKLIVLNIGESQLPNREEIRTQFMSYADKQHCALETVSARVQMELAELDDSDRVVFMADLGISESAFERIIRNSYELLGLVSFLTGGDKEVHAWTVQKGTTAQKAAGTIHKDFERGFIKAEVIPFEKLTQVMSEAEAKKRGWMRLEGKEYIVKDGDVIFFRFNV